MLGDTLEPGDLVRYVGANPEKRQQLSRLGQLVVRRVDKYNARLAPVRREFSVSYPLVAPLEDLEWMGHLSNPDTFARDEPKPPKPTKAKPKTEPAHEEPQLPDGFQAAEKLTTKPQKRWGERLKELQMIDESGLEAVRKEYPTRDTAHHAQQRYMNAIRIAKQHGVKGLERFRVRISKNLLYIEVER